jgi:hypothetical protein
MITNNDHYNEETNDVFDNPTIPDLATVYGLSEYAGYSSKTTDPSYTITTDPRIKESEHLVPTPEEIQYTYDKFIEHRNNRSVDVDADYFNKIMKYADIYDKVPAHLKKTHKHRKQELKKGLRDPKNNDIADLVAARNKILDMESGKTMENFDPWVNRVDGWDPEEVSDNWRYINTRGGNNILRL